MSHGFRLTRMFFLVSAGLALLCLVLVGAFWVFTEVRAFHREVRRLRATLTEGHRTLLRAEAERAARHILQMRSTTEMRLKEIVRSRVYEAHAIASNLYNQHHGVRTDAEIAKMIRDALRPIRFNQGRGYFFATNLSGIEELFADHPEMEGVDMRPIQDLEGRYVVPDMIEIVRRDGEGFYRYMWTKPDAPGRNFPKIAFVKWLEPLNWLIGTGEYLDDVESDIRREAVAFLKSVSFGKDGSLVAGVLSGPAIDGPPAETLEKGGDGAHSAETLDRFAETARAGGGYVEYLTPPDKRRRAVPRLSYVLPISEWKWYVAADMAVDDVDAAIADRASGLRRALAVRLSQIGAVSALALFGAFLISANIARRLRVEMGMFQRFFSQVSAPNAGVAMDTAALRVAEFRFLATEANRMILERQTSEAALFRERALLDSLFRVAPVGIAVVSSNRVTLRVNRRFCEMLGRAAEELVGRSTRTLYPDEGEFLRVGQRLYSDVARHDFATVEARLRRKEGDLFDVILCAAEVALDADSTGIIVTAVDISDRKQIERALREGEERLRTIVQDLPVMLCRTLPDGTIKFANAAYCDYFRRSSDTVIGANFFELIPPEAREAIRQHIEALTPAQPAATNEHTMRGPEGDTRWLRWTDRAIYTGGALSAYQIIGEDITERKRAEAERAALEEQLRQAQKMESIGRLAGGIAHDFNNILQAVLGYLSLVLARAGTSDPSYADLVEAERAAERAATLTRQLLAFSRRQVLDLRPTDLNQLVSHVLAMIRRLIGEDIDLRFHPAEGLPAIHADRAQIEQALLNLCLNARDAMPQGGELTIRTERAIVGSETGGADELPPGDYVCLTVADTGHGMDDTVRERVFEPFFTTKADGQGTGLGLSMTYGIVKQHNGVIRVYSEPGQGAVFRIYLPVAESGVEAAAPKPVVEEARGGDETLLLAEDDAAVRGYAVRVLENAGYRVLAACDGEEAVSIFETHADTLRLAILDVVMPRLGGKEAADRIRRRAPNLPILFTSGYSAESMHSRFILNPGVHLLQKPYDTRSLLLRVRHLLDQAPTPRP